MYRLDMRDKSIVIDGFQQGIADDPFSGIADLRNVNLISVPGEASVLFSTSQISPNQASGNLSSADPVADTVTLTGYSNLSNLQAITFSGASLPAGITAGTVYWVSDNTGGVYQLYSDWATNTLVNITGNGSGTWATVNMSNPTYFTYYNNNYDTGYFMVDGAGRVWTNIFMGSAGKWRYFASTSGSGNGLVTYQSSIGGISGTGYLFVFRDYIIDYFKIVHTTGVYTITPHVGWNPDDGTDGNNNKLKNYNNLNGTNHYAIQGPDNKVYYCDGNYISVFYQAAIDTPFDPASRPSYTISHFYVLPYNDRAQCITPLGNTMLIGGMKNVIYSWDTFSNLASNFIFIAEFNIVNMVTVNTNVYVFVGNRGRIWITNGSQAQLYKKIPDHISGTIEPYFTWGGACNQKNQLYFSASVTQNDGTAIAQYGGVWAIDLQTSAIRLSNKLSYNTYAGYAPAIIPNFVTTPAGTGLFIGWYSGVSGNYGIDTTVSAPYTGSQAEIVSDLIPIGTFDMPKDMERVEYKLTKPLVSGESITIYARQTFDTTDTGWGTAILSDSTVGNFSNSAPANFKNAQWLQLKAVLNSTATSPSYVRLKELRITGLQGRGPLQQLTI